MTVSRTRRRLLAGAAAATALAPFAPRRAFAQAKSMKLAWIRQFAPAGLVQKEVELAKAEGLEVELVGFNRGLDGLVALQKGDAIAADCLVGYSQLCLALAQGIDLTLVSGSCAGLNAIVMAPRLLPKDKVDEKNKAYTGTEPWKLLAGKSIGAARGSQPEFALRAYLASHGMDLVKDVRFIDLKTNTDQALALQQGSIDAAVLVEPTATQSRIAGHGYLVAFPYEHDDFARLNSGLLVRTDAVKQSPDIIQRLVNAHVNAIRFYQGDRGALAADTAKTTMFDPSAMKHLLDPAALGLDPKLWSNMEFDFRMPRASIEQYAKNIFATGGVPKDVSGEIAAHIDYSFLAKATGQSQAQLGG